MKNFGLNSLREIATSWGDVPPSERPAMGTAETLQAARTSILKQFSRFNLSLLQRYGRSGTLGDLRARMFNLKSMLSVLDDESEMIFLRDLFYSLYEHNSDQQIGVYGNGVKETSECLSPQPANNGDCQRDLLGMIPQIARMGLLHQSGLSLWNGNTEAVKTIIAILDEANHEKKAVEISSFIAGASGATLIRDVLSVAEDLNTVEQKNASTILKNASMISNQEWISFALALFKTDPSLLGSYSPTIHSILLTSRATPLAPQMLDLLSSISRDLKNKQLSNEVSKILSSLTNSQSNLQNMLRTQFSADLSTDWLRLLAEPEKQKYRDQISSFFTQKDFDYFCDVFSDATFVEKAYIFLDNSHQNSGVSDLLQECRRFLH